MSRTKFYALIAIALAVMIGLEVVKFRVYKISHPGVPAWTYLFN